MNDMLILFETQFERSVAFPQRNDLLLGLQIGIVILQIIVDISWNLDFETFKTGYLKM